MTVLILQIMSVGIYSTVDNNLKTAANNPNALVQMEMLKTEIYQLSYGNTFGTTDSSQGATTSLETGQSSSQLPANQDTRSNALQESRKKEKAETPPEGVSANTSILVMNRSGEVLNVLDSYSSLNNFTVDITRLNTVDTVRITNYYKKSETYRYITVPVSDSTYSQVAYVTIAINTTQLEDANYRYTNIVIVVMVFFWFFSIAASMYLAKWSRKPIQESLEKQKAFVENASHELRTPLAVIQNRLEALFRKPESTILDNSENIASSLDEVRNMRILTTNLLNLARRDDGIEPTIETVEKTFFKDIFDNYDMIAEENGKVFTGINQVERSLQTDKVLLKQLLTILFDNAMKYTEVDGQVTLTVKTTDRHLFVTVADNGPGIADSDKKKIFDRFYRVDKARTRQKGGFGLGLSLAQQIVVALKGTITVKDNQPKGTIFEVKLTNV